MDPYFFSSLRHEKYFEKPWNPLEDCDDEELNRLFRFDKDGILFLSDIVKNTPGSCYNNENVLKSTDVPCEIAVCITLLYLATNSFQSVIGKLFHINESAVGKIVKKYSYSWTRMFQISLNFRPVKMSRILLPPIFTASTNFPKLLVCWTAPMLQ